MQGNTLIGEPSEERFRRAVEAGNGEALAANGGGEQRGQFRGSGLPTAAVQAERGACGFAGGEQGQRLFQMKAVGEYDRRD